MAIFYEFWLAYAHFTQKHINLLNKIFVGSLNSGMAGCFHGVHMCVCLFEQIKVATLGETVPNWPKPAKLCNSFPEISADLLPFLSHDVTEASPPHHHYSKS